MLRSGVQAACSWGTGCGAVEDAFDHVIMMDNLEPGQDDVILTSSHADESLSEAAWFARECMRPPAGRPQPECVVIAIVGPASLLGEVANLI